MAWVPRVSGPPSDGMGAQGERPFFSGMGLGDPKGAVIRGICTLCFFTFYLMQLKVYNKYYNK